MPSPYVQDLFAALVADGQVELSVWYLEQEAPNTHWGVQAMPDYAEVLPGRWLGGVNTRIHYNPGIRRRLKESDADLFVIVGYIGLTNQIAMRTLSRWRRPWVFWGEIPGLHSRGKIGSAVRSMLQRPLARAAGIAGVGSRAVDAYRRIVPNSTAGRAMVFANIPYHCDTRHFVETGARRRVSTNNGHSVRFLYCGQLVDRKGVDLLASAMTQLVDDGEDVHLSWVGQGPMESTLRRALADVDPARIDFHGFQSVDDLPALFAASDVFVLPSRHDGWGVVVNQAIGSGMPIIASDAVGAANDLVIPGENGFRVPAGSADALLGAMRHFVDHPQDIVAFGRRSAEIAPRISLDAAVDDWRAFFSVVLGTSGRGS